MCTNNIAVKSVSSLFSWTHKWKRHDEKECVRIISISSGINGLEKTNPANQSLHQSMGDNQHLKRPAISCRMVLVLLIFFGSFNAYSMRFNLSVAMVAMVRSPTNVDEPYAEDASAVCPELMTPNQMGNSSISSQGDFDWDSEHQHIALGSFYFGYVAVQIPLGILAEKHYAKHFFGAGILITSVLTLLTPFAARWSIWALVAARTLQGIGQAAMFPAMNTLIGRWVPMMERSRVSAISWNGCTVGAVVCFAGSGLLCDSSFLGGWPSVFYVFGTIGVVWFVFWSYYVYESPDEHPHITEAELAYIQKGRDEVRKKLPIPWKKILTSLPVWGLVIAHIGQDWGNYTLITETPIYLHNVLHFDLKKNGFLSALPSIVSTLMTFLAAYVADKLRKQGRLGITTIRKIFNSIGFYGPGICLLIVAFVGCSPIAIITMFCMAMGLNGFVYSGFVITHVDMSPEFAGTLIAITNCIGSFTGFIVPVFIGYITNSGNTLHNWGIIYVTSFAVFTLCGTAYNIFCSADEQAWKAPANSIESQGNDKNVSTVPNDIQNEAVQNEVFRFRRLSHTVWVY